MKKILLFFIFFFYPIHVFAVSFSNITGGTGLNVSSITTGSVSLSSNKLELIRVTSRTATSTEPNMPSVSGDNLTWVPITSVYFDTDSSSRKKETVLRTMGTPNSGSLTISFSGQTQTDVTYSLEEVSGVDTSGTNGSGAIVQSNIGTDTDGGSISISLSSFGSTSNIGFGSFSSDTGSGTMTAGSGFTKIGGVDTSVIQTGSEYKVNQSSVSASFDSVSGARTGGIALEIKADSGPTPTPTVTPTPTLTPTATPTPTISPNRPDHIVVVMGENRKLQDVLKVDYFTKMATAGALMVNSKGLFHPSQPDYFALFSGSNQGVTTDDCPPPGSPYSGDNLGNQLISNGFTFLGYAENQPVNPVTFCANTNGWDNNHVPWIHFSNLSLSLAHPFTDFPSDFTTLPTVSFVTPNLNHDAHDGTIPQMSDWLKANIDAYTEWLKTHNSMLIITFDEDDEAGDQTIYTVFVGPMIRKGIYNESIDHYTVLSTIEDLYGLSHLHSVNGVTDIFVN